MLNLVSLARGGLCADALHQTLQTFKGKRLCWLVLTCAWHSSGGGCEQKLHTNWQFVMVVLGHMQRCCACPHCELHCYVNSMATLARQELHPHFSPRMIKFSLIFIKWVCALEHKFKLLQSWSENKAFLCFWTKLGLILLARVKLGELLGTNSGASVTLASSPLPLSFFPLFFSLTNLKKKKKYIYI